MKVFRYKVIVSQIKIAKEKNNNKVMIKMFKKYQILLDFLWENGLISGYILKKSQVCCIFLKYTLQGFIKKIKFLKSNVSYTHVKRLAMYEKNCIFFIKVGKQIYSLNVCIKKGLGGYLFIKS